MSKSRAWFFTLNNPAYSAEQLEHHLHLLEPKAFVFQLERGEEGTPHYQGCIYLKSPQVMPRHLDKRIHWEQCHSWVKAVRYCTKKETRQDGPWYFNVEPPAGITIITVLRPWQQLIVEELRTKPDSRKIIWMWEPTGNVGKTALAKYICSTFRALYLNGKGSDAKYAVSQYVKDKTLEVVVFGYPRTAEDYVSYASIEEIKDGIFFSNKYEAGMCMYDTPHVLVLANFEPDYSRMSADRWDVRQIAGPTHYLLPGSDAPPFSVAHIMGQYSSAQQAAAGGAGAGADHGAAL